MLPFLLTYWWLTEDEEQSEEYYGIASENIHIGNVTKEYNGTGVTILVFADGAPLDGSGYIGRGTEELFLNGADDTILENITDPDDNFIGTMSLDLAAGTPGVCNTSGVAPGAHVGSVKLINISQNGTKEEKWYDDLQYSICDHYDLWNISILNFEMVNCDESRNCGYTPLKSLPKEMITKCLYSNSKNRQKLYVAPVGDDRTDVQFSAPNRWPLVMAIAGVDNRGYPISHNGEGPGVFMAAPEQKNPSVINSCPAKPYNITPISRKGTTKQSAAIFAGALAVLMNKAQKLKEAKKLEKDFTILDYYFITAYTGQCNYPGSIHWESKNAVGLNYSRRDGFGRIDVNRSAELLEIWESVGGLKIVKDSALAINMRITSRQNITFTIEEDNVGVVVSLLLKLTCRDFSYPSLIPVIYSPKGTRCELKILTTTNYNDDLEEIELTSYKFLGEQPNNAWTLQFYDLDTSECGIILDAELELYCTEKQLTKETKSRQTNGADPYENPGTHDEFYFCDNESITLYAGESLELGVNIPPDLILENDNDNVQLLFFDKDSQRRMKIDSNLQNISETNFTLSVPYIPTTFVDELENVALFLEIVNNSKPYYANISNCAYKNKLVNDKEKERILTVTPNVSYANKSNIVHIKNGVKDLTITYALNLHKIIDDGYSTSAAISIINPETNKVIKRTFGRNTGIITFKNCVPDLSKFLLVISPSSTDKNDRQDVFTPINITIQVNPVDSAADKEYGNFAWYIVWLYPFYFIFLMTYVVYRIGIIIRANKEEREDDRGLLDTEKSVDGFKEID